MYEENKNVVALSGIGEGALSRGSHKLADSPSNLSGILHVHGPDEHNRKRIRYVERTTALSRLMFYLLLWCWKAPIAR